MPVTPETAALDAAKTKQYIDTHFEDEFLKPLMVRKSPTEARLELNQSRSR